jgi:predicted nucleotidyltransferase
MKTSYLPKDFAEFLSLLAKHKVHYVIVGGEAVIYHGYGRLTGDMDIFFDPSSGNAGRLFRALNEFWSGKIPGVTSKDDLMKSGAIIQFGVPPTRLDLMNQIDGVEFPSAWKNRIAEQLEITGKKIKIFYIGINDLVKNKEAIGRNKDLDDLQYLRSLKNK